MEDNNDLLKSKCKEYEKEFVKQADLIDSLEQYSRRNCALIHGIPESKDEKTDDLFVQTVNQHLGVNLQLCDLDRTHRLGSKKPNRPRPIIAKFARSNKRAQVFREKKKLKGTKLVITESLTRRRVVMLEAARKRFGDKNVWSMDGEIFTKHNGRITNVREL